MPLFNTGAFLFIIVLKYNKIWSIPALDTYRVILIIQYARTQGKYSSRNMLELFSYYRVKGF